VSNYCRYKELIARLDIPDQERSHYLVNDLSKAFSIDKTFTFLDMGAGSGSMSAVVLSIYRSSKGELVDVISRLKIEQLAPETKGRFLQHSWPAEEKLSGKQFDLVLSMDVLEHIPDWKTALRNLFKYVRNNGYLYIHKC